MDETASSIGILSLLILIHAVIVLSYTALTNMRQGAIREQADEGSPKAKRALDLAEKFTQVHITYQLSLLLLHIVLASVAAIGLAQPLTMTLTTSPLIIYLLVLGATLVAVLLLGDILPASLGTAYADNLALWAIYPVQLLLLLFKPFVSLTILMSKLFSRMMGSPQMAAAVTEEEIMTLVDAGQKEGTIEHEEKEMIFSVLQFGEILAYEVMIPRMDVVSLDIETSFEEALARFVETGHSRIPVYRDHVDNIEGVLYAKDLLRQLHNGSRPKSVRELLRKAHFVPESKRADLLLKEMQTSKIHMAVVVDEYGGTAGVVTIEDLLEEIVGDIQDEYDLHEEADYTAVGPGEYMIDGGANLGDVNDLLKSELPTDDSSTLGGYIYSHLGRVPVAGEIIDDEEHGLVMRVDSVDGRRIRKVHVALKASQKAGEATSQDEGAAQPEEVTDQA